MNYTIFFIFIVACCAVATAYFLRACKKKSYGSAFWLKAAASLCFVMTGLVFLPQCSDASFARLVFAGLLFGFAGDELLALRYIYPKRKELYFLAGMLAFALGHVLYVTALLRRDGTALTPAILYTAVLCVPCVLLVKVKNVRPPRPLFICGAFYILLVIFMGGCGFGLALHEGSAGAWIFAVGGLLFAASDVILSIYNFGSGKDFRYSIALHVLYYAAQLMIAVSLWAI